MASYYVTNGGENSTVTEAESGTIVFTGPYERAITQAAELNRQASGAYNRATTALPQVDAPNAINTATSSLSNAADSKIKSADKIKSDATAAAKKSFPNVDDGIASVAGPTWTGAGGGRGGQGGPTVSQAAENAAIKPVEVPKPVPNPLHEYATYTYGVTLYILSVEDYNNLQKAKVDALNSWTPTYSLISSAGAHSSVRRDGTSERQPAFKDDFYFDNLKMSTVIGLDGVTRGTNAIELSFSVIEPYGLTLLDRMIDAAQSIGCQNYMAQPYLLEIDFFGMKDMGDMHTPIRNLRKRIPIQIIDMKIKAGTKGSEYQINAIPFNHSAFSQNAASTPANFEVTAKTVADFFNNTFTNISAQMDARDKAKDDKARAEKPSVTVDGTFNMDGEVETRTTTKDPDQKAIDAANKIINSPYQVESYTGAINAWNQKIVDKTHYKVSNEIEFILDEAFANSPIVIPSKTNPVRSSFSGTTAADKKASAQGNDPTVSSSTPAADYDKERMTFNINAGTSIVDVVNMVMRNSQYIRNQVKDPSAGDPTFQQDKQVDYFKIIPQIIIKDFDSLRNTYATKTIYHIKKYSYFNSKHPNLPYGSPDGASKEYNYIYTGKNIDILDFNIEFNFAYFTTKVVDRDNKETTNPAPDADTENKPDKGVPPFGSGPNSIAGRKSTPVSAEMNSSATGADTAKTALVANAMNSIYTDASGDMITVNLKILGDPHFIKQDDLYTNPGMPNYDDKKMMINDGSIAMDAKEIFCKINFKTPVDMDDSTGLPRIDGKYAVSKFSGYYKVNKVTSEFSRGQFVQTLETYRITDNTKITYVSSIDRQEQEDEVRAEQTAESDSRPLALAGQTVTNPITEPPPTTILDKLKTAEESFVSKVKGITAQVTDEVSQAAVSIRNKLNYDLSNAKTMDVGVQVAADRSSPEPKNPVDYPLP